MKRGKISAQAESANAEANLPPASRVEETLDALYAAPFDRFVALRTELGRNLKAGGDPAGARAVAAAPKPTRTAWALNQVMRRSPAVVTAIVDAWKTASSAPLRREGVDLVDAARRYREAVAEVIREARTALEPDGVSLSPAQARRMAETLQALVRDETTRAELLRGRLARDVAVDDPFAGLDADAPEAEAIAADDTDDAEEANQRKRKGDESQASRAHAVAQSGERERLQREHAANQRAEAERERAERERAARERAEREAKARALEALRVRIASAEAAVEEAHHRVQDARAALARAKEGLRHAEIAAEQYETELESLRREWEKLAP